MEFLFGSSFEIVIATNKLDGAAKIMIDKMNELFISNKIIILQNESDPDQKLTFDYLATTPLNLRGFLA
ncbi:MAG: hypothetical protein AB1775_03135 [Bacteroidota bacterium]